MKQLKIIKENWLILVFLIILFVLLRFVFFLGYVPTESMEPTIQKGTIILGYRLATQYEKGDIVIFKHDGSTLVKRIAAVEGEQVEHQGTTITVPDDCYYMLGDNGDNSYDSRYWVEPFVRRNEIKASVISGKW